MSCPDVCLEPGKEGFKDWQDHAERKNCLEPRKEGFKDLQDPVHPHTFFLGSKQKQQLSCRIIHHPLLSQSLPYHSHIKTLLKRL